MKETTVLLDKINDSTLRSSDVRSFTKGLRKKGLAYASKDDVQWFQTYAFVLDKVELFEAGEAFDIRAGDWREAIEDFSKLKLFIDELEDKKLVNNAVWHMEGIVLFDIVNPQEYKKYLYNTIWDRLDRLPDLS